MLDAVVSADGEWIAFSLQRSSAETTPSGDSNDIWIRRTTGGEIERRAAMRGLQAEPAWSRDARWLYFFSSSAPGVHQIWRVSRDGADLEQITTDPSRHFDVTVSHQGDLAYSSNATGNYEIWLQRAGEPRRLALTHHPAADVRPSFAPEGDRLVFESSREGRPNLWIASVAGGAPRRLTRHAVGARSPAWWAGAAAR